MDINAYDEIKILRSCLDGDAAAFEAVVDKYKSLVCAVTYSAAGQVEQSEELAQQVFINAWRNLGQLNDLGKFKAWLLSITRNVIKDTFKRQVRDVVTNAASINDVNEIEDGSAGPQQKLIKNEQQAVIADALSGLPAAYREPLVLFYRQGKSTKEAAAFLDISEETVRARLHRGRKMLKEQVSAMIEETLTHNGPKKAFTAGVMATIGSIAIKGAATASTAAGVMGAGSIAASSGAGGAAVTGVSAVLGTAAAKIAATIIVVAAVTVGGAAAYKNSRQENTIEAAIPAKEIAQEDKQELDLTSPTDNSNTSEEVVAYAEDVPDDTEYSISEAGDVDDTGDEVKVSTRHPDWPVIGEAVNNIYIKQVSKKPEGDVVDMQLWVNLPDKYREEKQDKIIIDNSKDRITINKIDKTVQYSDSLMKLDPPEFEPRHTIERLGYIQDIYMFDRQSVEEDMVVLNQHDPNRMILIRIENSEDTVVNIYKMEIMDSEGEPENYYGMIYVDAATLLPENIELINNDPNSAENGKVKERYTYDYSEIDDSVFEYTANADELVLPFKEDPCFRGQVVNTLGELVEGADVFIHYFPLNGKDYLTAKSGTDGKFEIKLPDKTGQNSVFLPVYYWATLRDDSGFAGWAIFKDGSFWGEEIIDKNMSGYGGDIVQTDSKMSMVSGIRNGEPFEEERINTIQQNPVFENIQLVMEQTGTIGGYVTDEMGDAIAGADIIMGFQARGENGESCRFESKSIHWKFETVSQKDGYYEIKGVPPLWKGCEFTLEFSADRYVSEVKSFKSDGPINNKEFNIELHPQLVTISGTLKDNYGVPLAGRRVSLSVKDKGIYNCSTRVDPNGLFAIEGCPDLPGMSLSTYFAGYLPDNNFSAPKEELDAVLYYPEIDYKIGYVPGQSEYFVELTAIRPETTVEVLVVDSAEKPIPELKVQLNGEMLTSLGTCGRIIPDRWKQMKFEKRTDKDGNILFDNVPDDMCEMEIEILPKGSYTREPHELINNKKERNRLDKIDDAYTAKYQGGTIPIEVVDGQREYYVDVVVADK